MMNPQPAGERGTLHRVADLRTVISRAVRAERVRAGLTQEALGRAVGWERWVVSDIETGERTVAAEELPGLCAALGVTLDQLLRDADPADLRALGLRS